MRVLELLLLLVLISPTSAPAVQLKVLSFNISGLPLHRLNPFRFKTIANELISRREAGTEPDVVLLQEAFFSNVSVIVNESGYPYVYAGPGTKFSKGKWVNSGLYILSNHPFTKMGRISVSEHCVGWDCFQNKSAVHARIKIQGLNQEVEILTTHLQSNSDQDPLKVTKARRAQLEKISDYLKVNISPNLPMIFAGDFNLKPHHPNKPEYPFLIEITGAQNAGELCLNSSSCIIDPNTDPKMIWEKTNDQHLFRSSVSTQILPTYMVRNFTLKHFGETVSDHLGFEAWYEINNSGFIQK